MAASREVAFLNSFNGGLFLASQTSDLGQEFSPSLLNVDVGIKGGFVLRGGFHALDQDPAAENARFICPFYAGTDSMLIQSNQGRLVSWDGVWPATDSGVLTEDNLQRVDGQTFHTELSGVVYDRAYFANCWLGGTLVSRYFDGSTIGVLSQVWNNDYLAPSMGSMPLARYNTSHNGYFFVADTLENGIRFPHRVRFSHQNFPESWAEDDFFDVDPSDDGDPVTGLYQFKDMLVIFKRSSVWALYGPNRDSFILERITDASGISRLGAADANSSVLYWFSTDGRLMGFDGTGVTYLSAPLQWWSDLGYIQHGGSHRVRWMDGRLWINVECGPAAGPERATFVWDATVKAYTRYDKEIRDMIEWVKIGKESDPLFLFRNNPGVYRYDRTYSTDTDAAGAIQRINGFYRTSWFTAGETATRKRWKRPQITSAADADATLTVRIFHDFNENATKRKYLINLVAPEEATLWGPFVPFAGWKAGPLSEAPPEPDQAASGNMIWGQSNWYYRDADYYGFDRLGSAGSSRAVQYEFSSDDNLGRWWIDSIAQPYRRKAIK